AGGHGLESILAGAECWGGDALDLDRGRQPEQELGNPFLFLCLAAVADSAGFAGLDGSAFLSRPRTTRLSTGFCRPCRFDGPVLRRRESGPAAGRGHRRGHAAVWSEPLVLRPGRRTADVFPDLFPVVDGALEFPG